VRMLGMAAGALAKGALRKTRMQVVAAAAVRLHRHESFWHVQQK
jgi:hypothetical protein